ncbi:MAG: DUF4256 domain-containing protein [Aeromonas sp.]|uniref:DUF4256 domain-containing protein n=1 Tax=Aeromonas sp. TaxID=647 RepID=UPI003F3CF3C6
MTNLTKAQTDDLLATLQARFERYPNRHEGITWSQVRARLDASPQPLRSLYEMERTGGEPDVIGQDPQSGQFIFCDCSAESPSGRRSLCYDRKGLESRKENRPAGCATEMAAQLGIALLTESEYRALQTIGTFDIKTSSWIETPAKIRALGGALFCDCRYDSVFLYHNGAQSYYAARGFRGSVRV